MIPNLWELSHGFGLAPAFTALVLAGLVTGTVFFAQSIASWFEDQNP